MPATPSPQLHLTSGRVLAKSTIFNLVGQMVPVLAALVAIPQLIKHLGIDRFGLLNLVWLVIGYFGLFDLGLGRALTQLVAENLGNGDLNAPSKALTALLAMSSIGCLGTALMVLLAPTLVGRILNIPPYLRHEAFFSLYLMAWSVPLIIATTGLRGILEAHQRFGTLNTIRIPLGIYNFTAPLLVLPFTQNLIAIVMVLLIGRVVAFFIHLRLAMGVMPGLTSFRGLELAVLPRLLRFGGWITLTSVIGPLISGLDRLVIGSLVSVAAVAYYTTPQEIVSRAGSISAAIAGVLFPAFATTMASELQRATLLFRKGIKYTFVLMFPITLMIIAFARPGLAMWLGTAFADKSASILEWQAVAVFLSCFIQIPMALVQGSGRPELAAKLQSIELVFYFPLLWLMVRNHGSNGAAISWVLRMVFELTAFVWIIHKYVGVRLEGLRSQVAFMAGSVLLLAASLLPLPLWFRVAYLLVILIGFSSIAWFLILEADDKSFLSGALFNKLVRRSG